MSFFGTFKRILQGKPPFEAPEANAETEEAKNAAAKTGPKVRPEVQIERVTVHTSGSNMQLSCVIQNNSKETIDLDKIRLLGTSRELDNYLRPGEARQYMLYSGPRPHNDYEHMAELYYKDPSGDYFAALHLIEYKKLPDGTFEIEDFRLQHPIKDV